MQKIVPHLWFDSQAEEAMNFYVSCFPNSRVVSIDRYPEGRSEPYMQNMQGKVLTEVFELAEHRFMALDGGPQFPLNPSISFFVNCTDEAQVDELWARLSAGGAVLMPMESYDFSPKYGWCQDKFGISWQLSLGTGATKITPMLMFTGPQLGKAEEAMRLYMSLFDGSRIQNVEKNGELVTQATFNLSGYDLMVIDSNESHKFNFNEAISLYVECGSQEEVDHYWYALSADPSAEQCGWLKDKFGVSWQIVPTALGELLSDPDPVKASNVMTAMLQMKKLDVAGLKQAYAAV